MTAPTIPATAEQSASLVDAYRSFATKHPVKAARQLVRIEARPEFDEFIASDRGGATVEGLRAGLDGAVRCRICGRELRGPLAVKRRVGADCWARLKKAAA